jgi:parallel beta helix pectate lyase-like protein/uncharacterized protein DUF1565
LNSRHFSPKVAALAIAFALLSQGSVAATFYVATDGNDANPGSASAPFRTLQQATNAAFAGDTILVREGNYGHENSLTGGDGSENQSSPVVLYNSGSPGAPITIKSENQWGAVLDCELLCDAYINLYNASYIVIQDFVITRGYKEAIHSNDSAHHITLQGNRFEYIANRSSSSPLGLSGLYTNQNCHDFVIDRNVFHDIGRTDANWLDHGLYLHGSNFTITNNLFYNIVHGWSIQAADGLNHVLIANNTFAFPQGGGQDGQIMLWNSLSNLTIENNIFYNAKNYAITRYSATIDNCTIDHNMTYGASGMLADRSGCNVGATLSGDDPSFVNPWSVPFDFHLRPGSPAIGVGIQLPVVASVASGELRTENPGTDLGAYPFATPAALGIVNTTSGASTWAVGDGWTVTITGGVPKAQVAVAVGIWSAALGYTDESGNFTSSGNAYPSNIGTVEERWTVGGAMVNPNPFVVTVVP